MLLISLAVSAVLLVVINAVAFPRRGPGAGGAALCSLGAAFLLFCLTEALTVSLLLVAVAGAVCWAIKARRRWFIASSLGVTVATYATLGVAGVWEWRQLEKDNPPESLAQRLAYEERPRTAAPPESMAAATADRLASLEARLEQFERGYPAVFRRRSLELVHAGVVQQFINSPGFGVMRLREQPWPYYARQD